MCKLLDLQKVFKGRSSLSEEGEKKPPPQNGTDKFDTSEQIYQGSKGCFQWTQLPPIHLLQKGWYFPRVAFYKVMTLICGLKPLVQNTVP